MVGRTGGLAPAEGSRTWRALLQHLAPRRAAAIGRRLPMEIGRWLRVEMRDGVTLGRRRRARAGSGGEGHDFTAAVDGFRCAATLWRLVAVLRRWMIVAVVLALALGVVRWLVVPLPSVLVAAISLMVMVAGAVVTGIRSPTAAAVARLLDRRLTLREQVSTALEVNTSADNPLSFRLRDRAEGLATRASGEWRMRPVLHGGEWSALIAGLVLLGVLLTFARPASSAQHRPAARHVQSAAVPHVRSIRTTVVKIPAIYSSIQPATSRRIAQQLTIQSRGSQRSSPPGQGGGKPGGKHNGTIIPPGRATEAQFPSRKPSSIVSSSGGHGPGGQSGSQLVTSRRASVGAARPGGQKSRGSNQTMSIKGPRLAGSGNGPISRRTASGRASQLGGGQAAGRGTQQRNPYGPTPKFLRSVAKPGLVTGRAISSSDNPHGSNLAGRGRGGNGTASSHHLAGGKGRQLSLRSPYGSSSGAAQKRTNWAASGNQRRSAHVQGGRSGVGASDYILPDANSVGWGDSPIVAHYFTPQGRR